MTYPADTAVLIRHEWPDLQDDLPGSGDYTMTSGPDGLSLLWHPRGATVPLAEWSPGVGTVPDTLDVAALDAIRATPGYLSARQRRLITSLGIERRRRQTESFPHDGYHYSSDREESIPLMTAACIAAQSAIAAGPEAVAQFEASLGAGWRDVDGVPRITTAAGLLAMHASFVAWGAMHDQASQALKAQIAAADSADFAALEAAITDDASWP